MRVALRASKKLIAAIAALLASVILCIGVCLAWYATAREVDGSGMGQQLNADGIEQFDINVYYLDADGSAFKKATTGNVTDEFGQPVEVDFNDQGVLEDDETDAMRPYILADRYATAILFEINYILKTTDSSYRIFVKCADDSDLQVEGNGDVFTSPLSNSVFLANATANNVGSANENFTYRQADVQPFVRSSENYDKYYKIVCADNIRPVENDPSSYSDTLYVIMDYDPALFSYLSSRMLEAGGTLNSRLKFDGDITIGIETYNESSAHPTSIELCNDDSTSARFTQEQGVDVISSTWLFKVTYSDGSVRSVSKGSEGLTVDIDTITKVGKQTAAVSFKDGSTTVTTEVEYTITTGAHMHQYETSINPPTKTTTGTALLSCTCGESIELTLPVLTDTRYRITNNTATVGKGGTGTYTITINGMTVSFTAATDPLPDNTGGGGSEDTVASSTFTVESNVSANDVLLSLTDGGEEIATVTALLGFTKKDLGYEATSNDSALQLTLKAGYTYTVTMSLGSSGSARKITINDVEQTTGTNTELADCVWTITATGDLTLTSSSTGGKIRIASITITAVKN